MNVRARLANEEGLALAFALAFIALFGVLIAAVLSFGETGFRASRALQGQGDQGASIGGAIDGAINRARGDIDVGRAGYDATCFAPPALNGVTVAVRCEGQSGSGATSDTDGDNSSNTPQHAILTLGTGAAGEDGIVKTVADSTLAVTGSVFSNATINSTGTVAASAAVQALGDCTGTVTGSSVRCANTGGGANAADGVDPGWAKETTSVPTARTVPSCGSGWLVTFEPGTYNDAVSLTNLMNGGCPNKVFYFQPGIYYFHFDAASLSHVWTISDTTATVIGGTPSGWSTGAGSLPSLPVPGSCDVTASGVQWLFGGESRSRVTGGKVELCPNPNASSQRIALYGLTTGTVSATNSTQTPANGSSTAFSPTANALTMDGSVASASLPAAPSGSSAAITLSGYPGIPAGAIITGATIRVAHFESANTDMQNLTATVTPAGGSPVSVNVPKRASLTTETLDVLAAGLSPIVDATTLTVTYAALAKNNKAVTANLDGIEIVLTYETPQFEVQNGCLVQTPFTGSGAPCAFVTVSGTATRFVTHGTAYAPLSPIDLSLPATDGLQFKRGIVARTLRAAVPATWTQTAALFSTPPDSSTRADREVLFTARIAGVDRLRAIVRFGDGGGSTPGNTVTIDSWSVLR